MSSVLVQTYELLLEEIAYVLPSMCMCIANRHTCVVPSLLSVKYLPTC